MRKRFGEALHSIISEENLCDEYNATRAFAGRLLARKLPNQRRRSTERTLTVLIPNRRNQLLCYVANECISSRATMPLTPNRPSRCIHSCTPSVGNRRRLYTASAVQVCHVAARCCQHQTDRWLSTCLYRTRWRSKFSKSGVWNKVPEGSTLIFGDILNFFATQRNTSR